MSGLFLEKRGPLLLYRINMAPGLEIVVSTRFGGVSRGPYRELNLSFTVGDDPRCVSKNLELLKEASGISQVASAQQVHGTRIEFVRCEVEAKATDGLITTQAGLGLLIKQADCQAVVLYEGKQGVLANLHCGWRGLKKGLIARAVSLMKRCFGAQPPLMIAFIAPSLGPCCGEFRNRALLPQTFWALGSGGDHINLWAVAREQLLRLGLKPANIFISGLCTVCRKEFFSYRREGLTGRFGTLAFMR
ncbi:polyphenol oxidase family protein [Thermosulfuriphilus sp.]